MLWKLTAVALSAILFACCVRIRALEVRVEALDQRLTYETAWQEERIVERAVEAVNHSFNARIRHIEYLLDADPNPNPD